MRLLATVHQTQESPGLNSKWKPGNLGLLDA